MMTILQGIHRGLATVCISVGISVLGVPSHADGFFTLKGHGGPIKGIAVSPSEGQIATASFDNSVGLWQDGTPHWLEQHRAAVNTVTYADDNLMISAGDDFALVFWHLDIGQSEYRTGHQGKILDLGISSDRGLVASASWDGSIGLWPTSGEEPRFLKGHRGGVNAVAFRGDDRHLYSASADGTVRVWSTQNGEQEQLLLRHGFGINTLTLDPGGTWLAYGAVDGVTRVVDPETGEKIADFTLDRRPILSMASNRSGTLLAVGDGEGFIMLIDTKTWTIAQDFRAALRGPIWALTFSADDQSILAGGIEDIVYSWPIADLDNAPQMAQEGRTFLKDPDQMSNGERQFQRKCSICHSLEPSGKRKAGPTLFGVFDRSAGTVTDYKYSQTLQGSDIVWGKDTIDDLFDLGPDHFIPGSKMPMQRITAAQDRADLIDFLQQATSP